MSTLITQPWNYDVQNGFGDTTAMLRGAMVKNPYMGLRPQMHKNITWDFYQSGHMLYIDGDSHAKLKHDVSEFIQSCLPAEIR